MKTTAHLLIAALFLSMTSSACITWFPDKVGNGVARLAVRNAGALTSLISADDVCGFESSKVLTSYTQSAEDGGFGTVTWRVEGCEIDTGSEWRVVKEYCDGTELRVRGKVTITAEKIVDGHVTGNPERPAIPIDPDAATIRILSAEMEEFEVQDTSSDSSMRIARGSMSADLKPRLAANISKGLCSIPTSDIEVSDLNLFEAKVYVNTPDRKFDTDIGVSNINAIIGLHNEGENRIGGMIRVWGSDETVDQEDGLDPEYNRETFVEKYSCTEDLATPISHSCELAPRVAEASGRLSVKMFANLVKYANAEESCGFESPIALSNVKVHGAIGYRGGDVIIPIESDCILEFPEPTVIAEDCNGDQTIASGKVILRGTKQIFGIPTGDPEAPAVPTSNMPAIISLNADLENFELSYSNSDRHLAVKSGRLSGSLKPRMFLDTETGACSASTPNAEYEDVVLSDAQVSLFSSGNRIDGYIERSIVQAVSGIVGETENFMDGEIQLDGESYDLPLDETSTALDPDYHEALFAMTYDCVPEYIEPAEGDCTFETTIAEATARLVAKNWGVITKRIDDDEECGFARTLNMIPSGLGGNPFDVVTANFSIEECTIGNVDVATDCLGTRTTIAGYATVTGEKTVTGAIALASPPIQPLDRNGAMFRFTRIDVEDYAAMEYEEGSSEAKPHLILHEGTLTGYSHPVTGEAADSPGRFFIKTPVSKFRDVTIGNTEATLMVGQKQFKITIDRAKLTAFNGTYHDGETLNHNSIEGEISIDGKVFNVPVNIEDPTLNPDFEQETFDASYVCKENLKEPVPSPTW